MPKQSMRKSKSKSRGRKHSRKTKVQRGGVSNACVLDTATGTSVLQSNGLANLHNINPQASLDLDNKFMAYGGPVPLGSTILQGGASRCGDEGVGTRNGKPETFKQYLDGVSKTLDGAMKGGSKPEEPEEEPEEENPIKNLHGKYIINTASHSYPNQEKNKNSFIIQGKSQKGGFSNDPEQAEASAEQSDEQTIGITNKTIPKKLMQSTSPITYMGPKPNPIMSKGGGHNPTNQGYESAAEQNENDNNTQGDEGFGQGNAPNVGEPEPIPNVGEPEPIPNELPIIQQNPPLVENIYRPSEKIIGPTKGGGFSTDPGEFIGGMPVYKAYDDCCPPAIVNGQLKFGAPDQAVCGFGAVKGGSPKRVNGMKKKNSNKQQRKTRGRKQRSHNGTQRGGDWTVATRSKPAMFDEAFNGPASVFAYPDDMSKRAFGETQPNYTPNAI